MNDIEYAGYVDGVYGKDTSQQETQDDKFYKIYDKRLGADFEINPSQHPSASTTQLVGLTVNGMYYAIPSNTSVNANITNGTAEDSLVGNGGASSAAAYSKATVFGTGTTAFAPAQLVCGLYNSSASSALFIVGDGTSTSSKNAFSVANDGNIYVEKNAYINCGSSSRQLFGGSATSTAACIDFGSHKFWISFNGSAPSGASAGDIGIGW